MDTIVGSRLGAYLVEKRLGQGGMATIFLAVQPSTGRRVAIKTLPKTSLNDAKAVARFEREAKVLAALQHPHILPLIDYGESGDYKYLVVPFLSHGDLEDRLNRLLGPMDPSEARRVLVQLGEALDHAHSQGVIHRDLKPGNVLLDAQGNAILADFGIAHQLGSDRLTGVGFTVGTPEYMAPEQVNGQPEARSDLYALGVLGFRLLTGALPYKGSSATATLLLQRDAAVPDPLSVHPGLSTAAATFLMKALAKDKNARFQTGAQFAAAARAALPEYSSSAAQSTQQVNRPAEVVRAAALVDSGTQPLPSPPQAPPAADPYATTVSGKFSLDPATTALGGAQLPRLATPAAQTVPAPALPNTAPGPAGPAAPGMTTVAAHLLGAQRPASAAVAQGLPEALPTGGGRRDQRTVGIVLIVVALLGLSALAWWWLNRDGPAPPQIVDAGTPAPAPADAGPPPAAPIEESAVSALPPTGAAPLRQLYDGFDAGSTLGDARWEVAGKLQRALDQGVLTLTATAPDQRLDAQRSGRFVAAAARVWMPAPIRSTQGMVMLTLSREQWWLSCYLFARRERGDVKPACQEQGKVVIESADWLQAGWHDLLVRYHPQRREFSYSVDGREIGRFQPRLPSAPVGEFKLSLSVWTPRGGDPVSARIDAVWLEAPTR